MDDEQLKTLQDWLETQKVYWQSLINGEDADAADWNTLLDSCRKMAEQQLPPQNAELAEAMAQQAKGFCKYGELLLRSLSKENDSPNLDEAVFEFSRHLQDQTGAAFIKQWQLPEQLSHFFSNLGINIPSLPGFPFFEQGIRNSQDHFKTKLTEAEQTFREFRDALNDYVEIQKGINHTTTHQLLTTLKAGEDPTSLEDLYRLWVDHYEKSYLEQLQTPGYQQTYSRLSNASLTLQKLNHEYWEQEYRSFGLVPLKDYDQLLERHHKLRKSLKVTSKKISQLEQQLLAATEHDRQQQAAMATRLENMELKLSALSGSTLSNNESIGE
ncbi:MAG: poly(R)-hydroxyalkanoic acid synthase subunit PhaE [Motiliproteus sp.]